MCTPPTTDDEKKKAAELEAAREKEAEPYFQHYWKYATLWRTWVIGVAVGAVFILLHENVSSRFECRARIATLFVAAAGVQVILAFVNKTAAYYQYAELKGVSDWWTKFWCGMLDRYWLDFVCDIVSFLLVAAAVIFMIVDAFVSLAPPPTQPAP
jgi:hypothetical protein